MNQTVVGVDPGNDGGLCVIRNGAPTVSVMPSVVQMVGKKTRRAIDEKALVELLEGMLIENSSLLAIVEKVGAMPKQGVASIFKFGTGYGQIRGILAALGIPYVLVTPQRWKKEVLSGLDWKGNKKASITYVQRRFPDLDLRKNEQCRTPHDGICDAVCLALYGLTIS